MTCPPISLLPPPPYPAISIQPNVHEVHPVVPRHHLQYMCLQYTPSINVDPLPVCETLRARQLETPVLYRDRRE